MDENKLRYSTIVGAFLICVCATSVVAESSSVNPNRASGGMSKEFKNAHLAASDKPRPLKNAEHLSSDQRRIVERAAEIFEKNSSALTMLILDRGDILFEAYRNPASEKTPQFSWSMSKSLVAYTIGLLYCDGLISSLNDAAEKYAPELQGTVFGEASIRNLLTMSSGAKDAVTSGNSYKTSTSDDWQDTRNGKYSGVEIMRMYGKRDIESGKEFRYLGNDTQALNSVVHSVGGLLNRFDAYIWQPSRLESGGYWLLDKDNRPIAQAGLSATTRDWARLALYSIDLQKYSSSECVRKYMQQATTQQIKNNLRRAGQSFPGYGYQTWVRTANGRSSYWWVGFGGQRVGVDPDKEKVIVVTSWREDYMSDVYKLFAQLQSY